MKPRDLSKAQFLAALKRHGMKPVGFMGYVEMFDGALSVSMLNANTTNRRARLAYLLAEKDKYEASEAEANEAEMQRRHREDRTPLKCDPAGRTCPDCADELNEVIPLDSNGTCHGCGSCFGKAQQ